MEEIGRSIQVISGTYVIGLGVGGLLDIVPPAPYWMMCVFAIAAGVLMLTDAWAHSEGR